MYLLFCMRSDMRWSIERDKLSRTKIYRKRGVPWRRGLPRLQLKNGKKLFTNFIMKISHNTFLRALTKKLKLDLNSLLKDQRLKFDLTLDTSPYLSINSLSMLKKSTMWVLNLNLRINLNCLHYSFVDRITLS